MMHSLFILTLVMMLRGAAARDKYFSYQRGDQGPDEETSLGPPVRISPGIKI